MKIYIINENAKALKEKCFNELTNEEIEKMHETDRYCVDCYESVEDLAANWNSDNIFYPWASYMRVIND